MKTQRSSVVGATIRCIAFSIGFAVAILISTLVGAVVYNALHADSATTININFPWNSPGADSNPENNVSLNDTIDDSKNAEGSDELSAAQATTVREIFSLYDKLCLLLIIGLVWWRIAGKPTHADPTYRTTKSAISAWIFLPWLITLHNPPRAFMYLSSLPHTDSAQLAQIAVLLAIHVVVVFLVGITEEMYRVIAHRFFVRTPTGLFIIVGATCFGLLHGLSGDFEVGKFLLTWIFGAAFAIAYVNGASLWHIAVVHMLLNFGHVFPESAVWQAHFRILNLPVDLLCLLLTLLACLVYLCRPSSWKTPVLRSDPQLP